MKIILGTLTAAVLAGAMFVQPAQAACWSNGYATHCSHHMHGWGGGWHHRWHGHRW